MKLCSLTMDNEVVCEVTADYPLLFSVQPRLNKGWLREVLASAINTYILRRRDAHKAEVVKA